MKPSPRVNASAGPSTSAAPRPSAPPLRGMQKHMADAASITIALGGWPIEKMLFATQLDRAVLELARSYNAILIDALVARQGVFVFSNSAVHDVWLQFSKALLDLRTKYVAISSMSSASAVTSPGDAPPAYEQQNMSTAQRDTDPLTVKIAHLLSSRESYESVKSHFLLLQHSQSLPGSAWAATDFAPPRSINGVQGTAASIATVRSMAAKMTGVSGELRARLPLAESVYRLVSPEPTYSIQIVESIKLGNPPENDQSSVALPPGELAATLGMVQRVLDSDANALVREAKTELALRCLASLEINGVGNVMEESQGAWARFARIRMSNELVSLRLALLQAISKDSLKLELLRL